MDDDGYILWTKPGYIYDVGMATAPDDILQRMKMAARRESRPAGGRGKRSNLFKWLYARFDDFQALLDEHQPSWSSIAKAFEGTDVSDGKGKVPSPERVRKAWLEVRQAKGLAKVTKRSPRVAPLPSPPIESPDDRLLGGEKPARTFGQAELRGHRPSEQLTKPEPEPKTDNPPAMDADKVLAQLLGKPSGSRFTPKGD